VVHEGQKPKQVAILWVSEEGMLRLVGLALEGEPWISQRVEVPNGTILRGVIHDPQREAFGFKLEHPSFEKVWPGEPIPWISSMSTVLKPVKEV
jgi:hypothetical protein